MSQNAQELISILHSPTSEEIHAVEKAFSFASEKHQGQHRQSGEPYFVHVFETAKIIAQLGMSGTTVAAGLLHDTAEDCNVSIEEIKKEFGDEIAFLVDGVTKLGTLKYRGADRHNESLRKLFVAMSEDIRVLMIKLSDRLHNMRTLSHVPTDKQKRIATETLEIYAPIAYRLGIRKLNRELEDLAFPYVYPKEYAELEKTLGKEQKEKLFKLEKFIRSVKKALAKEGIVNASTDYRVKGFYSLYKKLLRKDRDMETIYDLSAIRVLVDTSADCYRVLGVIHASWRPLPGRIKDYIAFPKPNGYQGLHTTVFTGDGNIIEVQIKTRDMHTFSEYGFASHVSYKKGGVGADLETMQWVNSLLPKHGDIHEHLNHATTKDVPKWIKELVSYQEHSADGEAFKEQIKNDFFSHRIFVFSPKGDVVDLPVNSTPLDFAYSIHSDIGDHTAGAKVNGKLVSLETTLKNGDIVEVMTKSSAKPNKKWSALAKTSTARRHIQRTLFKQNKEKR
jgi:guanosine-3',5'-bis(diphosphate) 3'-pyrophosphohydrolase